MSNESGETLTYVIFAAIKVFVALFVLKVILMAVGFPGYIPVGDEVFAFVMKAIMLLGTGSSIMPTRF